MTAGQIYTVTTTLEQLEQLLAATVFFRVNRSTIIAVHNILNYSFWENEKYILRTKTNEEFIIARDRLRKLKQVLHNQDGV
jgi:two-component system LytT family response regulator